MFIVVKKLGSDMLFKYNLFCLTQKKQINGPWQRPPVVFSCLNNAWSYQNVFYFNQYELLNVDFFN